MEKRAEKEEYPYESFIQKAVIKYLDRNNAYGRSKTTKRSWEHGVDIKVRHNKYSRYWLVEVKGGSNAKSASSVDTNNFVFALGQILTRIQSITPPVAKKGSRKYGVAYPDYFVKFLERRRLHWNLCKSLNLYIFLVNEKGKVEEYDWKRIKEEFYSSI